MSRLQKRMSGVRNYGDVFPSSQRRGGRAVNKKSRSHLIPRRRGGQFGEMFRPEDFAELTTPAAPNRKGNIFSWRVHPSSARRGLSSPMQDSSDFKISSCLIFGFVKYVDALTRKGMVHSIRG